MGSMWGSMYVQPSLFAGWSEGKHSYGKATASTRGT